MADSIREQIISALISKMADMRTSKGYNTECGQTVKRAELIPLAVDSAPLSSLYPMLETGTKLYKNSMGRIMEIRIQAISVLGGINASIVSEKLLADLIECIMGFKWTMEIDSGGTYEPQVGDIITGETDGATAIIEAVTLNSGTWGGADADATILLRRLNPDVLTAFSDNETLNINGNANAATVDGALTGQGPKELATNSLAESIDYISGGTDSYPENQEDVVGAERVLNIGYKTRTGDPYTQ